MKQALTLLTNVFYKTVLNISVHILRFIWTRKQCYTIIVANVMLYKLDCKFCQNWTP